MPVELVPLAESTSEIDDLFGPEPVQQPKAAAPKVELVPLPDEEPPPASYTGEGKQSGPGSYQQELKRNASVLDYPIEAGKSVPHGAISTVGTMAKGIGGTGLTSSKAVDDIFARMPGAKGLDDKGFNTFLTDIGKSVSNPAAAMQLQAAAWAARQGRQYPLDTAKLRSMIDERDVRETTGYKAGEGIQKFADDWFGPKQGWEKSWTTAIGSGFGSSLPFLAAAFTGPLGLPLGTLGGVWASTGEQVQDAIDHGATPEQIKEAARLGQLPGLTEQIPFEILVDRIPVPYLGRFFTGIGRMATQAAIEGGQEAGQQTLLNWFSQLAGYDPNRSLTEDVANSAAIGAVVGGGFEAGKQLAGLSAVPGEEQVNKAGKSDQEPLAPAPSPQARKADKAPVRVPDRREAAKIMRDAGYTPEDVLGMTPEQLSVTLQELIEQGGQPDVSPRETKLPDQDVPEVRRPQGAGQEVVQPLPGEPQQPVATTDRGPQGTAPVEAPSPAQPTVELVPLDTAAVVGEGTRAKPVRPEIEGDLAGARDRVNVEPSEPQKQAGNYRKGHVKLHGLDITIENPKGSTRRGKSPEGVAWESQLPADYGYIKRSTGSDGDQTDVYIGPNTGSSRAVVIDQRDPKTGKHDEYKVVLGVDTTEEATDLYEGAFSDGSGASRIGGIEEMDVSQLKDWLANPPKASAKVEKVNPPSPGIASGGMQVKVNVVGRDGLTDAERGGPLPKEEPAAPRDYRAEGAAAFAAGKGRMVPRDVVVDKKAAKEWAAGWDRANLDAPVPRVTDTPEAKGAAPEKPLNEYGNYIGQEVDVQSRTGKPDFSGKVIRVDAKKGTVTVQRPGDPEGTGIVVDNPMRLLEASAKKPKPEPLAPPAPGPKSAAQEPDPQQTKARTPGPKEAPAPKQIGVNADGNPVFEDERGVRSFTRDGIRTTEKVAMRPTREGMEISKDAERDPRFEPADLRNLDEIGARLDELDIPTDKKASALAAKRVKVLERLMECVSA